MKFITPVKVILLVIFLVTLSFQTGAVTPTVSASQLQQIKNLPIEQQRALAAQYGIDLKLIAPVKNKGGDLEAEREIDKKRPNKDNAITGDDVLHSHKEEADNDSSFIFGGAELAEPFTFESDETEPEKPNELSIFGLDIFSSEKSNFEPLYNVPVPSGYVLGPGDEIQVQLFGKEYQSLSVSIDRSGTFMIPETGPIQVAGLTFSEFKEAFQSILNNKVIGVKATVTMGQLRSVKVFVLGDVQYPGAYTISSMSTVTHALMNAGGPTNVGSLRNVQLKRKGKIITTLDLYDLFLNGDSSNDSNLLAGDVIFVPPVGSLVSIDGEVKRPAKYELKSETSVSEILKLAGGSTSKAYLKIAKLERIDEFGTKTVIDFDFQSVEDQKIIVKNGDHLTIDGVISELFNVVKLKGHVYRPGVFAWRKGMRVLDVINSTSALKDNPDLRYALIIREDPTVRTLSAIQFSLMKAFDDPQSIANPILQSRDEIVIFSAEKKRNIDTLVQRLTAQSRRTEPAKIVEVVGNVEYSGKYPLTESMTVKDLIDASFDLKEFTDLDYALLKRLNKADNLVDFAVVRLKDKNDLNMKLKSQDKLYVFNLNEERETIIADLLEEIENQTSKTNSKKLVSIQGQVRFPGTYPLASNMTAKDLVAAAGGYTESSFLENFNLSRFTSNGVNNSDVLLTTIDMKDNGLEKVLLKPKDSILIKRIPDWMDTESVELKGEFVFPGKYTIRKGETLAELVKRAGGFTEYANVKGSIFTRQYLKEQEQEVLERTHQQLKKELSLARYNSGMMNQADIGGLADMLEKIAATEAVGRMVVNTKHLTEINNSIELRDGDSLIVPRQSDVVSVIGQVYQPTALPWDQKYDMEDYIDRAGGPNQNALEDDSYIIKANGEIAARGVWGSEDVEPGDTIMVPADVSPIPTLTLWQQVTSIIAQSATTLALIATL